MRQSMTYGILPDRKAFHDAFWEECPNGKFKIENDKLVGNALLTESQLWYQVKSATHSWNNDLENSEELGDWASCVLYVLGFEWV